ncbi:hypothetical protein CK203_067019 [Vitis vinifera]|uniref:Reverse transcriptase zinc-binding domain-containing protein n=1 Tax=Vitis vinifera TaxID=29760 RepID=A0A438F5K2_VITVI|nr:hypothetical protein CK203_067019 [Vitis vinifera]
MDWDLVGARILFLIGNGRRVRLWRDRWCGDPPLCVPFPSLFDLSVDKEAWMADIWDPLAEGVGGVGILVFQEPSMIGRWKRRKDSWSGFMGRECLEMWKIWCFGPKQRVESFSQVSIPCSRSRLPFFVSSSCIWNVWVQPKISSFAWKLLGAKP